MALPVPQTQPSSSSPVNEFSPQTGWGAGIVALYTMMAGLVFIIALVLCARFSGLFCRLLRKIVPARVLNSDSKQLPAVFPGARPLLLPQFRTTIVEKKRENKWFSVIWKKFGTQKATDEMSMNVNTQIEIDRSSAWGISNHKLMAYLNKGEEGALAPAQMRVSSVHTSGLKISWPTPLPIGPDLCPDANSVIINTLANPPIKETDIADEALELIHVRKHNLSFASTIQLDTRSNTSGNCNEGLSPLTTGSSMDLGTLAHLPLYQCPSN